MEPTGRGQTIPTTVTETKATRALVAAHGRRGGPTRKADFVRLAGLGASDLRTGGFAARDAAKDRHARETM